MGDRFVSHGSWSAVIVLAATLAQGVMMRPAIGQTDNAANMVCTSVDIQLPDRIVFHGNQGDISARVKTDIRPGRYTILYTPDKARFVVSPWKTTAPIIDVSVRGTRAEKRRYRACLASMTRGVPLVVIGTPDGSKVAPCASCEAGSAGASSGSSDGAGHDQQSLVGLLANDTSAQIWQGALQRLAQEKDATRSASDVLRELDSQRQGVTDAPSLTAREVVRDPERVEQWNALDKWEKGLWNDFLDKYRDSVDITQSPDELSADAGVRFTMALSISYRYMPEGIREGARELLTDSTFLTTTMVAITAYLALWMAPEPIFSKATAVISTVGLVAVAGFAAGEIIHLARMIQQLSRDTEKARTMADIERAAERFGKSFGAASLRVLLALALIHGSKHMPAPPPAPAAGFTDGALAVAGAQGGTVATAIPRSTTQIKVLADGTVKVIQGGMAPMALNSGASGSSTSANRPPPGEWQPVNESMSPRARAYQEQITGKSADQGYVVDGVRFDGYRNGKLIEAKGEGYETFMKVEGGFLAWFERGAAALMKQARRQNIIAQTTGVPVEWHVAEERFAALLADRFKDARLDITVIHAPRKP